MVLVVVPSVPVMVTVLGLRGARGRGATPQARKKDWGAILLRVEERLDRGK